VLLLDTHIVVWWLSEDERSRLSVSEKETLNEHASRGALAMSAISLWEIQMLVQKKRLKLTMPFERWIREMTQPGVINVLPLDAAVIIEVNQLPKSFHGDPADRIIAATAIAHEMKIMSHDRKMKNVKS